MPAGTTAFPTALDSNEVLDGEDEITSTRVNNAYIEIEAIEAKVGKDSSAVTTTHDYLIAKAIQSTKTPIRQNRNSGTSTTYQASTNRRIEMGGGYIAVAGTSGQQGVTFASAFPDYTKVIVLLTPASGFVLSDSLGDAAQWLINSQLSVSGSTCPGFLVNWISRTGAVLGDNLGFFWMAIGEAS